MYAPSNEVSVNDGPHIRRRPHKFIILEYKKGKGVPYRARCGPGASRRLRLSDFMTFGT
jgi:hypothetical protein